jgi:CMP-N-acetylneuraminic acid synthetase
MSTYYHECKVYCYSIPEEQAKSLNIEDQGRWLPFTIYLGSVNAFKMSTDEEDPTQFCTTIYTDTGDVYIIDTPYVKFSKIWTKFMSDDVNDDIKDDNDNNDIEL